MSNSNASAKLYLVLLTNAVFSGLNGVIMTLFSKPIAAWMGISNSIILLIIGLVLLGFAAFILTINNQQVPNTKAIRFIVSQDMLWVLGSVILLVWNPFQMLSLGKGLIAVIAVIVGVFAFLQNRYLHLLND
ncbi:MAG: hypothetical protein AAF242_01365 [Bacteroidota bacterium]